MRAQAMTMPANNDAIYILGALGVVTLVLGGSQFLCPRLAKYIVGNDSMEFRLFGTFSVWKCRFDQIADVCLVSFSELFMPRHILFLSLMNRPFSKYVLLRTRSRFFRGAVITPD